MADLIVTGASGQLGKLVLKYLTETYKVAPSRIIAVSRSVDKLADWKAKGVVIRPGDFNDAKSLKTAFEGAQRMLLVASELTGPVRVQQNETAIREAAAAGVKHIVFTGLITPPSDVSPGFPDLIETEDILKKTSGISYAILGFNFWTESLLDFYGAAIATGTLYTTSPDGNAAHGTRNDYAKACAAALASTDSSSAKYEITGPETLDRRQVIDILNRTQKPAKPIEIVQVSEAEIFEKLNSQMHNEAFAKFAVHFDSLFRKGHYHQVGDGFFKLTGQQPEKVSAFFERYVAQKK